MGCELWNVELVLHSLRDGGCGKDYKSRVATQHMARRVHVLRVGGLWLVVCGDREGQRDF